MFLICLDKVLKVKSIFIDENPPSVCKADYYPPYQKWFERCQISGVSRPVDFNPIENT